MISANKNICLDWFLYFYFRRLFRKNFYAIYARGIEYFKGLNAEQPVICFATHTNWWDGLVAYLLSRVAPHKKTYCMMEEKQLKYYRFFTWLGAFSVDLSSPLRAAASVHYSMKLLQDPETLFWIFPQGKICSVYEPIQIKNGTTFLANQFLRAQLLPVVFRYEFFQEQKPVLLIQFGKPYQGMRPLDEKQIGSLLETEFFSLNQAIEKRDLSEFVALLKPRMSLNKRWEWLQRVLSRRLKGFNPTNDPER